jgi:simple sugar transport system ATP-binding protein
LDRPAWENFLLGLERSPEWNRSGLLSRTQVKERAYAAMTALDVRPLDIEPLARSFSGGNQQKIIIARELYRKPKLLIAAQPTRGVDVGAIELIHSKILEAKSQGMGVLLISSELDEILALSDRVLVMYQGRVVLSRPRGECTDAEIGLKMGGG